MKEKIYIRHWLEFKPYRKQATTDGYYLKVANNIKKSLISEEGFVLWMYISPEEINLLSCFLTSYFEDIISGTQIWKTFIRLHTERYGKRLPFYDTSEYYDDEINLQDVAFLIWYFMNTMQEDKFISPYNEFIIKIAGRVIEVFDEEYEYAPENDYLKSFYQISANETDYYTVRKMVDNVLFGSWLFYSDTLKEMSLNEAEILETGNDQYLMSYLQENRDTLLHSLRTRLLSLKGNEWAAAILGPEHPLSKHLMNISQRIRGYFFYKGQDEHDVFLEYVATGHQFRLTKKSFDYGDELTGTDSILYLGIVKWMDEWWFSGVYVKTPFNADLVLDEKNSVESRKQVSFLDHESNDMKSILQEHLEVFKRFNNGSQIAFMPTGEVEKFVKGYYDFYNSSLNISPAEKEEAVKRAKAEGFLGGEDNFQSRLGEFEEQALVFFNPESGIEMAFGVTDAFPLPNNPLCDIKNSDEAVIHVLMSDEISAELAKFCIEKGKSKLPFFKQGVGKEYLKDIDFLLRFWKGSYYLSKPEISFTGRDVN